MMNGKFTVFINQYDEIFSASTISELKDKVGGGAVSKKYVDKKDGRTVHNGYVIGSHWLTAFRHLEIEA